MNAGARLELLRHGDTGQRSYRGQLDDPLSGLGWAQLRAAVEGHAWDRIVSSTLQRCAAFASELAQARGLPLRLDARLAEYHFGDWQGVPVETLAERDGEALARFWADPVAHPPPGAETFAAFRERLSAALDDAAREADGGRVLVVTHGGAIRLLRCLVEGRGYGDMAGIEVPHASLHPLPWPAGASAGVARAGAAAAGAAFGRDGKTREQRPKADPATAPAAASTGAPAMARATAPVADPAAVPATVPATVRAAVPATTLATAPAAASAGVPAGGASGADVPAGTPDSGPAR